jgi:membrane-associated phospholipid phosphatase
MKVTKLLLAAFLFTVALYVFLLGPDSRAETLSSIGVHLRYNTVTVLSIQAMVVGLVLGIKTIIEERHGKSD